MNKSLLSKKGFGLERDSLANSAWVHVFNGVFSI